MKKKILTLTENHLFSKAYAKGRTDANKYTAVYVLKNFKKSPDGKALPSRLGITINRKLGKAVKRSRVKRILREAYREFAPLIPDGQFIIIAARKSAFSDGVKSTDIALYLKNSLNKLGLIKSQNSEKK